jgi:hypothetical protein
MKDILDNSNDVLKDLLAIKSQIDDEDEILKIKNQINFSHALLLTKDKITKLLRQKMS